MKFSIITPSFRQLECLKLCIRSVEDQGADLEHIIQDAGTGPELEQWVSQNGSAQLFVEKDEGMYDAVNRGLRRAHGDILAYLNCDEQYLEGTLEKVERYFTEHPEVDVLFGDAVLTESTGQPLSYRRTILPQRLHVRWVHLNTLTCSTFFRRSVIDRGFFFDPRWKAIGDADWIDRLLAARVSMGTLGEPLSIFAFTGENLGGSDRAFKELDAMRGASWKKYVTPLVSLHHRIRKWSAGAYRRHRLDLSIYTPDSPDRRKQFADLDLGFNWPKGSSSQA